MRCTACEADLDAFVDGSLPERRRVEIVAHVGSCSPCAAFLEEIRSLDGILLGLRHDEPARNFTVEVMTDTRAMRAPVVPAPALRWILAAYLLFAWGVIGLFRLFGGRTANDAFGTLSTALGSLGSLPMILARLVARLLGATPIAVSEAAATFLAVDAALVIAATVVLVRRVGVRRGISKRT